MTTPADLFVALRGLIMPPEGGSIPVKIGLFWSTAHPASIVITATHKDDTIETWEASSCEMSRSALANVESGQQRIAVHQLMRLARVLGVEPTQLLPLTTPSLDDQAVDRELVQKGVPEQTAKAVAKAMSAHEGGRDAASAQQSGKSGAPGTRRGRRHQAPGPR